MYIPACTCWPLTVILGSEAPSCIHLACISIYPFLYYHDNLCWTQGLKKLMFPANSHALFTRSVIFILHLFVIFMASHSQDSIAAFMRSLIANWDCHHLKHLLWYQRVTHYVQVFTCQPETSDYQTRNTFKDEIIIITIIIITGWEGFFLLLMKKKNVWNERVARLVIRWKRIKTELSLLIKRHQ